MSLPALLDQRLRLPMVAAPMFLVSNPQLVLACCRSGIVGSFPALNQRESSGFEGWLEEIGAGLQALDNPAPYAVNLIVHNTNPRLQADLRICVEHRVPIVITSLGAVREVVDAVHSYGGLVFHDVTTRRHAEKAAEAGVDGLIAVAAGAGGHAGTWSPFALVAEIRQFFDKTLLLAGCINHGHEILAAQMLGADLAYLGTRFIATRESNASDAYKQMILEARAADIAHPGGVRRTGQLHAAKPGGRRLRSEAPDRQGRHELRRETQAGERRGQGLEDRVVRRPGRGQHRRLARRRRVGRPPRPGISRRPAEHG